MKRFFTFAAVAVLTLSTLSLNAQNKFKGIIKYNVTSTGEVAMQIPPEVATPEVKVMGEQVITTSPVFTNGSSTAMVNGNTSYTFLDLSQALEYLKANDITLNSYSGDGKIYLKHTYTQLDVDSLTIPVKEGFYIEYVAGQTKKIAGYETKLARLHTFDEEGTDHPVEMWYSDEMGPQVNFLFNGVKGLPLEYTINMDGGKAYTITAAEVVKGKVKDVDFLMPAGFNLMETNAFSAFMEEFQEEVKFLREE